MVTGNGEAQRFNWLLANFVRQTDGVIDAVAVSSDGLLMAKSEGLDRAAADQLAAIVSGITGLARGASRRFGFAGLRLVMIEMNGGFLIVSAVSYGSSFGVLLSEGCDVGLVGYEMSVLADRAGAVLTPHLVTELKNGLGR
ncbi:MAG TPA: roadblock/LC7 domain-containing protein [Pseudonocardiaceae bacterium]